MAATFREVTLLGSGNTKVIPNGSGGGVYGYGSVQVNRGQFIVSTNFTGCTGIITYTPSTGLCTMLHHPPMVQLTSAAYLKWLGEQLGATAASTKVYCVGGKPLNDVPAKVREQLKTTGLVPPAKYCGPRLYGGLDVRCDSLKLSIKARSPTKLVDILWTV